MSCRAAARTSASSTACGPCRPQACARDTSSRMSRSAIGVKSPHRPQVRRRSRRRISSTSRKPRVVMTPIFGPRRSSNVLVPTVVPCTIEPSGAPPSARRPLRKPDASSPRRDGTFAVGTCARSTSKQNRSVNVPPTSTPTTMRASFMAAAQCRCVSRRAVGDAFAPARHVAEPHVARDALGIARRRIAEAAAARRFQPHVLAARDLDVGDLGDQRRRLLAADPSRRRSD